MKALLAEWDVNHPGRLASMMTALGNTSPSHLLDRNRYDFASITTQTEPVDGGDTLFDQAIPMPPDRPETVIPIWKK